jgi:hypothetical protein
VSPRDNDNVKNSRSNIITADGVETSQEPNKKKNPAEVEAKSEFYIDDFHEKKPLSAFIRLFFMQRHHNNTSTRHHDRSRISANCQFVYSEAEKKIQLVFDHPLDELKMFERKIKTQLM